MVTFLQQETTEIRDRIRAAWATFHKYRQDLTSTNYLLKRRLRLFDAVITPTICYTSGTWTPTIEHERMIQSAQLIIQTKRRYKNILKQKDKTNEEKHTNDLSSTGDESEDGQSSNTHKDQDSDVSFENDTTTRPKPCESRLDLSRPSHHVSAALLQQWPLVVLLASWMLHPDPNDFHRSLLPSLMAFSYSTEASTLTSGSPATQA